MATAAAAVPVAADDVAREMVAKLCDNLITRSTFFTIFDESRGSTDYARWRKDLEACMKSAGTGFRESLLFQGSVPEAPTMTDADIMLNTAAGHTQLTMPQMRQQALLMVICATLPPDGESIKLIRACVHAGGVVQRAGVNHDQALIFLDRRWLAADVPEFDVGSEAKKLHAMEWPAEFSVDAYNTHFNLAVTRASRCNLNPSDDSDSSV